MAKTIEELDKEYEGREEDANYLVLQAVLGTEEERERAFDEDGNFHCIGYWNCQFCPAFDPNYCI